MGTSHKHTPSMKGNPNWGQASAAITALTGEVLESEELRINPLAHKNAAQIEKRQIKLGKLIKRNYHKAVRHLLEAAGGRSVVSSGRSRAVGYAGISVIGGFVSAIHEIVGNGLSQWLRQRGQSLEGKKCSDIIDIIRQYVETEIAGLDNTAANEAMECVLDQLESQIGGNIECVEDMMKAILSGDDIRNMIDLFFGMYVYSHLSQDFEEKLEYEKGSAEMKTAMSVIKEQILDDIKTGRVGRDVRTVNWSKPEGEAFIKSEFNRILFILQGNES